ncbi:MAG: indolepyruvate ferredoxin oxidoreductase subunit alpha, partial [Clostridia bacterium]|nr:indolepyruvate ferredoxin oxidoreductase subunit alpha [Clostridia bacterium]
MGNEAAAIAAIYAGVRVVCGYPGTPSTETLETVAKNNEDKNIYVEWSVNEKAALEVGAGAAYAGARTMVTMKQVGLNACADPVMSLAYIGVKGGMVIYVADDPGPISSQTEQDTRRFGLYSKLPVLDPTSPEELFDMIGYAFDLSEEIKKPVIVRPTTRICHACASVDIPDVKKSYGDPEGFVRGKEWVIFPRLSYGAHIKLEEISESLKDTFSSCQFNSVKNKGKKIAVVASGAAYPVANELISIYAPNTTLIKLGAAVPFPEKFLLDSLVGVEKVLVAEELDAVIEDALYILKAKYNLTFEIHGKRDGVMPHAGEYTAQSVLAPVCDFLGATPKELPTPPALPVRPPVLCAGCPHRASFYAVKRAMKGKKAVFSGDIGCYTLGNAMPLDMVDTCLCMGAGVTIAQGLAHVESDVKHFAFIGDSTFFHSGITGIVNAVYNNADVNIIILDNSTTAMTGHQPHPGTGVTMMKEQT